MYRRVSVYMHMCCLLKCLFVWLLTYTVTYLLTPWSRVLLQNLTGSQPVKKFPAFYGTRRFITAITSARHLCLSWARSIQSIPPHLTSCRPILHICYFTQANLQSVYFIAAQDTPALSHRTLIRRDIPCLRRCSGRLHLTLRLRMRGAFPSTVPHTSSKCGG
jgi:hypothetical protein